MTRRVLGRWGVVTAVGVIAAIAVIAVQAIEKEARRRRAERSADLLELAIKLSGDIHTAVSEAAATRWRERMTDLPPHRHPAA